MGDPGQGAAPAAMNVLWHFAPVDFPNFLPLDPDHSSPRCLFALRDEFAERG